MNYYKRIKLYNKIYIILYVNKFFRIVDKIL